MEEVKLHGFWYSPFTVRVVWALKLKGLPYENIEEDRFNKSPQLLQYNPVYKKTPVLVHGGKPICESMIIVEYIDEIWPQNPLLSADPYERAQARFWVKYADDMLSAVGGQLILGSGEALENAVKKSFEFLEVVEDRWFSDGKKFFGGDTINIADIAFGSIANLLVVLEDMHQVKILKAEKFPHLHSWFYDNFSNVPAIKENLHDREKTAAFLKPLSEQILAKASS